MIPAHDRLNLSACRGAEHLDEMEAAGSVEYFLLDQFVHLLVDGTRSSPELYVRRLSGAEPEASSAKEQHVVLQAGEAHSAWVHRIVDQFRQLLLSEHGEQRPVQRDRQEGMNGDAFRLATLPQRSRQCRTGIPFDVVFETFRLRARGRDQAHQSIHQVRQQLTPPRVRGPVVADNLPHCDWFVGSQFLIAVEAPQYLPNDYEYAHAIATAVRGCEEQIVLDLGRKPDYAQVGLIGCKVRR